MTKEEEGAEEEEERKAPAALAVTDIPLEEVKNILGIVEDLDEHHPYWKLETRERRNIPSSLNEILRDY
ncbi:hypothetical protein BDW75DRAFT_238890 [Aspergillus navahoensis]